MTFKSKKPGRKREEKGRKPSRPHPPEPAREAGKRPADEPARRSPERIAKAMARAGLCSRREAEQWIAGGRVRVNGAVIGTPALNVGPADRIEVDGKPLPRRERTRLFLFNKPRGLVTTNADPERRPTIFGALPKELPRLVSVGRLDLNTEGLLLLTNDGGLARVLELPQTGWLRRYRVRAHGEVTQAQLDTLREGIELDGIRYGPIEATLERMQGSNIWLTFAMREGKNREVRNVLGHLGLQVNRLIRISFGPFQLGDLADGAVQEVATRVLAEQLGERIVAQSGVDLSGPIVERERAKPRAERAHRPLEDKERRAGRDRPADKERRGGKDLRETPRKRRPKRRDDERRNAPRERGAAPAQDNAERTRRAGLVKDRKGRRIFVERIPSSVPKADGGGGRPPHGRRRYHGKRDR